VGAGGAPNQVYQLPYAGRFAWENSVANPYAQDKTIVIGTDDGTGGQVYVYVGNKQNTGNAVERAGLNNGRLYAIRVNGPQDESSASNVAFPGGDGTFSLVDLTASATETGAALDAASVAAGATRFLRPEDSAWDPTNNNRLYFATTDRFNGRSRIWRATFKDLSDPVLGGRIEVVADGMEQGFRMADNLTVDGIGHIVFQEDVGNNAYLGRVLDLDPATGTVTVLATHDATRFLSAGAGFLTQDEESSGIIDVTNLFVGVSGYDTAQYRYFLLDTQAHYGMAGEWVEGGQLQLMAVPVPNRDLRHDAGRAGLVRVVGRLSER
jgi:secreted PhoX family phosphatase